MMLALGLDRRSARASASRRPRTRTRSTASYKRGLGRPRAGEGEDDARVGDPDRQPGQRQEGGPRAAARSTASSSRRREAELADAAARADRDGPVHLPAHRRRARRAREARGARRDHAGPTASSWSRPRAASSSPTSRSATTRASSPTCRAPTYANHPVLLPNDYTAIRDAVRRVPRRVRARRERLPRVNGVRRGAAFRSSSVSRSS